MSYLKIDAEAKGEITIGGGPILANHLESAEYVRGTMLRGALAGLWPRGELGNEDFLNLFCRGRCKFLGLFPVDKDKYQSFEPDGYFPYRMPLSMTTCKYYPGYGLEGHGYHDRLLATEKKEQCASCEAPIERVKGASFCYLHHTGIEKRICDISPSKGVVMRHGANRKTRRADYGKLYSYTVINKGERFVGWIAGEDNDLEMLKEKLSSNRKVHNEKKALTFELRVGRSRKKNYLQCTMSKQAGLPYPKVAQALVDKKFVLILLQTSAILLDRYFRPCTKVLPEFVFYGLKGVSPKEFEIAFPPFSAQSHIDSWSNLHGLPREPETAISAGSIVVFRFANGNDLSGNELCKIWDMVQIRGIGERRMEGFGQVLINPEISLGGVR